MVPVITYSLVTFKVRGFNGQSSFLVRFVHLPGNEFTVIAEVTSIQ